VDTEGGGGGGLQLVGCGSELGARRGGHHGGRWSWLTREHDMPPIYGRRVEQRL
jgi:hypothetical protein